jgi:hypothetical protein
VVETLFQSTCCIPIEADLSAYLLSDAPRLTFLACGCCVVAPDLRDPARFAAKLLGLA